MRNLEDIKNSVKRESHLMMVAAYYENLYNDAKADSITPENLRQLNESTDIVKSLLTAASKELRTIAYHGVDFTHAALPSMANKLDDMVNNLKRISDLCNKRHQDIKLEDYPID